MHLLPTIPIISNSVIYAITEFCREKQGVVVGFHLTQMTVSRT
jgi:hypothetical protein